MISVVLTLSTTGRRMVFPLEQCIFEEVKDGVGHHKMTVHHGSKTWTVLESLDELTSAANRGRESKIRVCKSRST